MECHIFQCPGVSLRSTPGYLLKPLRGGVAQTLLSVLVRATRTYPAAKIAFAAARALAKAASERMPPSSTQSPAM